MMTITTINTEQFPRPLVIIDEKTIAHVSRDGSLKDYRPMRVWLSDCFYSNVKLRASAELHSSGKAIYDSIKIDVRLEREFTNDGYVGRAFWDDIIVCSKEFKFPIEYNLPTDAPKWWKEKNDALIHARRHNPNQKPKVPTDKLTQDSKEFANDIIDGKYGKEWQRVFRWACTRKFNKKKCALTSLMYFFEETYKVHHFDWSNEFKFEQFGQTIISQKKLKFN